MKRKAEYRDGRHRIISMPNGQWQAQQRTVKPDVKGQNAWHGKKIRPHFDPWAPLFRPTDRQTAINQMDAVVRRENRQQAEHAAVMAEAA